MSKKHPARVSLFEASIPSAVHRHVLSAVTAFHIRTVYYSTGLLDCCNLVLSLSTASTKYLRRWALFEFLDKSHVRRYYIESIPLDNNGKELPGSKGAEGREFINLLFKIEEEIKSLSYDEKKPKRREASRPVLDAFWAWVEKTSALVTTNEKLTQALTYSQNQRKYLETFIEDGRLPISNNLCEANIKPFATARRAWLFADPPKGAKANAILYTLVESARANKLNVFEYLKDLLTEPVFRRAGNSGAISALVSDTAREMQTETWTWKMPQ